jgi:hypothetical protein
MNILSLLTSGKDYITIVKEFIEKVFIHEEEKYKAEPSDLTIIINRTKNKDMQIMTYSNREGENKVLRIIPDKEVQEILTK